MSNELLNAYISFGEPNGDDLDFSQIADWAGYLLQEQRERIAEIEAENHRLRDALEEVRDMMGTNLDYTMVAMQALEKET